MSIKIEVVRNKKDLRAFLQLPYEIYRGDPNWVAPLLFDQKRLLDPKVNPFFLHAQMTRLVAKPQFNPSMTFWISSGPGFPSGLAPCWRFAPVAVRMRWIG